MEKEEKGLTVNIENYTGEKPIEVIYRTGVAAKAQESLPTKEPVKVNISGVISTPFDWLEKRIDLVDQKRANVLVNRESMTITLTVNEDDEYTKGVLKGTVELSEVFKKFNINGNTGWILTSWGSSYALTEVCLPTKSSAWCSLPNLKTLQPKQRLRSRNSVIHLAQWLRCTERR